MTFISRGPAMSLKLMMLPAFVLVLYFSYFPIAGLVMAFQDFQPSSFVFGSPWVGLENFRTLLSLPNIWKVFYNTLYIALLKGTIGLIVPLAVALLLNELNSAFFKRSLQTILYLPHFLSWVILAGIFIDLFSPQYGIVNGVIRFFSGKSIFFMGDNRWFPTILVGTEVWKEFGFNSVIFLAALAGIGPELYEAASVDGAGHWRRLWHITLPGLAPIIILCALLNLGNILNAGFEQVFNMYSPIVYQSGDIIDTFVFRLGLQEAQYSLATAVGLFRSATSTALLSGAYYLAYKIADYRIF